MRIWHIGLDESFLEKIMDGEKYEQAQQKIINTVRSEANRSQRMRASVSRGNLNAIRRDNVRSAS